MLKRVALILVTLFAAWSASNSSAGNIKSPGTWTGPCDPPGLGLACLPEAREGLGAAQIANQIIVSHGFSGGDTSDTRIYDIDTDTWFDPVPVPAPVAIRSELAAAAHGGLFYAVGGRGLCVASVGGVCADLEVYDPVTNAWAGLAPMPTARAGLAAAVVGNKLYAIGGRTGTVPGSGAPLDCLEAFDIAAGTWGPACGAPGGLALMPTPAMDVAAIAHGGRIYVIGGAGGPDPGGPLLSTVQIYNVAKDSWSLGTSMPTSRANLALGKCGSVILALGGRTGPAFLGPVVNTAVVEAYDIPKDMWVVGLSPMPTAKSEHGAASHGGVVYAIGSGIFGVSADAHEGLRCSSLFQQ